MKHHRYAKPEDLYRAQAAFMQWAAPAGQYNTWHKGDIGHRLFNGCFRYDKRDVFRYWLDAAGEVAAIAILYPHWQSFDLHVAPELLYSPVHAAIFEYCEWETARLAQKYDLRLAQLFVEGVDADPAQLAFIQAQGYTLDKHSITMTRHDLRQLPDAPLPAGFRFHRASAADAARLADVHNHSFTNKWNAESYSQVFNAPHMEQEWVVIAPDGRCAAFTNLWIDQVSRSMLFEPVGTHEDFRRLGVGKALMAHALKRMRAERGITCAFVCHEPPDKNPASAALYKSVGFVKLHDIYEFVKPLTA